MDGTCTRRERDNLIAEFKANKNIRLFLLSTRACSHGINLVGANRDVIFDSSWNPCYEQQALARIYRHEQTKPCFVYRLVLNNCIDQKIFDRQVNKHSIAHRVVDDCNPDAHITIDELKHLCWDVNGEDDDSAKIAQEQYEDIVIQETVVNLSSVISKCTRHYDNESTKLTTDEKKLALKAFKK